MLDWYRQGVLTPDCFVRFSVNRGPFVALEEMMDGVGGSYRLGPSRYSLSIYYTVVYLVAPTDANLPSHARCQDQPPFVNAQDDKSMAQVCNRSHIHAPTTCTSYLFNIFIVSLNRTFGSYWRWKLVCCPLEFLKQIYFEHLLFPALK